MGDHPENRFAYLDGLIDKAVWIEKGKIKHCYTAGQLFSLSEQERKSIGLRRLLPYKEVSVCHSVDGNAPLVKHSLTLKNVEISFGEKTILKDISFSVQSGDVAAITGVNGVGKTSLCRTICGFLECRQGEIAIDGAALKKKQRLRKSYIVMQDTNYQLFAESVLEECFLGNPLVSEEQVKDILKCLDLLDVRERHPQSLSGGQKQRLAIAVAVLADKNVIILDEPTSGLDYSGMMTVSKLMKELAQTGIIVLVRRDDMSAGIYFSSVLQKKRKES